MLGRTDCSVVLNDLNSFIVDKYMCMYVFVFVFVCIYVYIYFLTLPVCDDSSIECEILEFDNVHLVTFTYDVFPSFLPPFLFPRR